MFLQCDKFVSNTGKFTDSVYSEILQNLISAEVAAKMSAGTTVTHVSTQMPSQPPGGGQETSATVQSQMSEQNPTTTQVATGSQKVPGQQPAIEVEPATEPLTEASTDPAVDCLGEVEFMRDPPDPSPAVNAKPDNRPLISGIWQQSSDYVEHLLRSLNQQRADAENCDFTVQIFGAEFPVHKCVLSAGTSQFNTVGPLNSAPG